MSITGKLKAKFKWKKVTAICVASAGLVLLFQNCGGGGSKGVRIQHELPYSKQKVIIAKGLFATSNSSKVSSQTEEKAVARAPKNLSVTVLVNNKCALDSCRSGDESKILTCYLIQSGMHEQLKESQQFYSANLPQAMSQQEIEKWIGQNPVDQQCIVGLSEQHTYKHSASFNDTQVANQQDMLNAITYPASVDVLKSGDFDPVRVAIIDTGVEDHGDMLPVTKRVDAREPRTKSQGGCPANMQDYYGHGTFVAGIIAAKQNNGQGLVGLAPNAQIYSYQIGRCGDSQSPTSEMANAVLLALDDGAEVINLSYGGNTGDDTALRTAMLVSLNSERVLVISAGNDDADVLTPGKRVYPAAYAEAYPGIITVAATDNLAVKAKFSNFNPSAVKIAAPGVGIWSLASSNCQFCQIQTADPGGSYSAANGTSFSAPIVTAAAVWTVGFLKKYHIPVYADYVENLVTNFGGVSKGNLLSVVRNGRFLSFNALAASLLKIKPPDATDPNVLPTPSTNMSYTYTYSQTAGGPVVSVTVSWNLPAVHPGARVGIYDQTCGDTSAGCLIVDAALSGPVGSYTFTLTRDQLVPMLASKKDPAYALNLMMAVHYPIPDVYDRNGKPIKYKNNHGLDAKRVLNVRDFDGSTANSELLGQITNIRMDMQYLYVQGWACFTGSNGMVTVGLQDEGGTPITSYYSYNYDLMVPHGTPIDSYGMFHNFKNLATLPYSKPFYVVDGVVVKPDNNTTYLAGLEANPQNVLKCGTVTASHGFEFIVPLWQISQSNLALRNFKVVGSYVNKKDSNKVVTAPIPDRNGRSLYAFPDVNFQTTVKNNFRIDRTSPNSFGIIGSICSNSPSPVEVEVSATYADYYAAVFGDNGPRMPDAGGRDDVNVGYDTPANGFVADPNFNDANSMQRYTSTVNLVGADNKYYATLNDYMTAIESATIDVTLSSNLAFKYELTEQMDINDKQRIDWYAGKAVLTSPNTIDTQAYIAVQRNFYTKIPDLAKLDFATVQRFQAAEAKISAAINAKVKTLNLRQAASGLGVNYYNPTSSYNATQGAQLTANVEQTKINRAPTSMGIVSNHWDYYDVGVMYSNDVIGYAFDITKPVGAYLKDTYKVDKILREVKKYETPLSSYSVDLAHGPMIYNKAGNPAECGSQYQHYVNPLEISNRVGYMSDVTHFVMGFWVEGHNPRGAQSIPSPDVIMQRLPLNLRFFQDGKMILHIESNYGSNWGEVRYPYQSVGYK